jgi:hypothetical protein
LSDGYEELILLEPDLVVRIGFVPRIDEFFAGLANVLAIGDSGGGWTLIPSFKVFSERMERFSSNENTINREAIIVTVRW